MYVLNVLNIFYPSKWPHYWSYNYPRSMNKKNKLETIAQMEKNFWLCRRSWTLWTTLGHLRQKSWNSYDTRAISSNLQIPEFSWERLKLKPFSVLISHLSIQSSEYPWGNSYGQKRTGKRAPWKRRKKSLWELTPKVHRRLTESCLLLCFGNFSPEILDV